MSRFFIDRPIVAIVIALLTVILGVVSLVGLPIAQYPSIIPPIIQISTTFTGADAVTIEQSVATPIEQQMNGVDKMLYVQSTNASDGTMTLSVTFDVETEVNIDQVNAQNRVSQAQPNLPADVNQFGLTYRSTVGLPLMVFALYSPNGTHDSLFDFHRGTIEQCLGNTAAARGWFARALALNPNFSVRFAPIARRAVS